MTDRELVNRNVVVLPAPEIADKAIQWSEEIAQRFPTEFTLNQKNCLTHLSLYQAPYPAENGDKVLAAVREVAATLQHVSVKVGVSEVGLFWGTFVFWDAVITSELTLLHELLLQKLNPLREGELLPIHRQILEDTSIESYLKNSIRQYGNPLCGEAFRPHIALTRCKQDTDAQTALRVWQTRRASFRVTSLVVSEVGPHGTLPKILAEFPLVR